jgi:hypothetical protein
MPRVRHNAKSIEKRYNSLKILINEIVWNILPTPRKAAILKRINVAINDDRKSDIWDLTSTTRAETYTRLGTCAPASNNLILTYFLINLPEFSWLFLAFARISMVFQKNLGGGISYAYKNTCCPNEDGIAFIFAAWVC